LEARLCLQVYNKARKGLVNTML